MVAPRSAPARLPRERDVSWLRTNHQEILAEISRWFSLLLVPEHDHHELDARSLRGLAHPLRVRILGSLRTDGPSTATRLAELFGQSSGTTSWHLRQLAEHGFVEQDPERGNRRERWWRAARRETELRPEKFGGDPELGPVLSSLLHEVAAVHHRRTAEYVSALNEWPREWRAASELSDWVLSLSPRELARFTAEARQLVERYRRDPESGDEQVLVQLQAFPRGGAAE
ncbi:helix-turn-helix transcriptional regulator [Actinopolyspora sp. BKK1]|nr:MULTISPECIES: helix-turn-helix domain-containing protein [unclassified Actinopolyspora]NHD17713.1 helix-turn-helix transcriptional regulator [Actinopolyspora sp. BKK2]NHE76554.1 helix-turn-helix transcriptional regulator [Actinopolyspora sp. BKK1]